MALVLSLAVSASCFAAGASGRFAAEEKAADALVAALTGNGGTYEQVSKSFSQALKEKLTAQQFAAVQDGIKKQVSGIDELVYFGTVTKDKFARIFVSFVEENNAPKVIAFQVTPIEPAKQQPAPAKK